MTDGWSTLVQFLTDPTQMSLHLQVKEEFAMDTGPIICQEIEKAIRDTKGKS